MEGETELRELFVGWSENSYLNRKTPVVPFEDLPYTLSVVATISSQHGIERIQSNFPLSPIEYCGNDKISAQVINKRALLLPAPLFSS